MKMLWIVAFLIALGVAIVFVQQITVEHRVAAVQTNLDQLEKYVQHHQNWIEYWARALHERTDPPPPIQPTDKANHR